MKAPAVMYFILFSRRQNWASATTCVMSVVNSNSEVRSCGTVRFAFFVQLHFLPFQEIKSQLSIILTSGGDGGGGGGGGGDDDDDDDDNETDVIKKEAKKILKYKDLALEIQHMWNVNTKVIPIIIGANGTNLQAFRKYLSRRA
jgi:hypothetical protein